MENILAAAAVILIVCAIIYAERVQRGTSLGSYGKKADLETPENTKTREPVSRGVAIFLSILLPGSGHICQGDFSRGVRYAFVAIYCWFSIGIAIYNDIPMMSNISIGILLLDTLHSSFKAASVRSSM